MPIATPASAANPLFLRRLNSPRFRIARAGPAVALHLQRTHMATYPYFVVSPSTVLSLIGVLRGPDRTRPTPAEDWRDAKVDVIIPALNEADNIVLCLASVLRQTMKPRRIMLIDDGSRDGTVQRAKAFCRMNGVELTAIQRRKPIGKTPTIKRQARELDSDVEFILDADTVLESDNYIERTVQELYQAVGIASAFGTILPQRRRDRQRCQEAAPVRAFNARYPSAAREREGALQQPEARHHESLSRDAIPVSSALPLSRAARVFRDDQQSGGLRGRVSPQIREGLVRPHQPDSRRRSDELRGHLHRVRDGERRLPEHSAHRRVCADGGARGAAAAPPDLPVVVVVSAVLLLLRSADAQPVQGVQAMADAQAKDRTAAIDRDARPRMPVPRLAVAGPVWNSGLDSIVRCISTAPPSIVDAPTTPREQGLQGNPSVAAPSSRSDRRVVREPYRQAFGREPDGDLRSSGRMDSAEFGGREDLLPNRSSHHADLPQLGSARGDNRRRNDDLHDGACPGDERASGWNTR